MSDRPTRVEAEDAIRTLLSYLGDDPYRPGLLDTPARVVRAWDEYCHGIDADPKVPLRRTFSEEVEADQMILVRDIDFVSHCEHHMAPFRGVVHVAYIPGTGKPVVGLSKIPRAVKICAARFQIQERLTAQIADAMDRALSPAGVAVMVEAEHQCMTCRGVQAKNARMRTTALRGVFRTSPEARTEFFSGVSDGK